MKVSAKGRTYLETFLNLYIHELKNRGTLTIFHRRNQKLILVSDKQSIPINVKKSWIFALRVLCCHACRGGHW